MEDVGRAESQFARLIVPPESTTSEEWDGTRVIHDSRDEIVPEGKVSTFLEGKSP